MGSRDNSTFAREVITYMEKLDNSTCWAQVVIFIWLGCCSVVAGLLGLLLGWLFSCLMYVFVYILFGLAFVLLLQGFLGYCWLVVSSFTFMSFSACCLRGSSITWITVIIPPVAREVLITWITVIIPPVAREVIHCMGNSDNSTFCS